MASPVSGGGVARAISLTVARLGLGRLLRNRRREVFAAGMEERPLVPFVSITLGSAAFETLGQGACTLVSETCHQSPSNRARPKRDVTEPLDPSAALLTNHPGLPLSRLPGAVDTAEDD